MWLDEPQQRIWYRDLKQALNPILNMQNFPRITINVYLTLAIFKWKSAWNLRLYRAHWFTIITQWLRPHPHTQLTLFHSFSSGKRSSQERKIFRNRDLSFTSLTLMFKANEGEEKDLEFLKSLLPRGVDKAISPSVYLQIRKKAYLQAQA